MKRVLSTCALLATIAATPAMAWEDEPYERWAQQERLKAEFRKARELGGYNDPITALRNILAGETTDKDITPGINSIRDIPGREGIPINDIGGRF